MAGLRALAVEMVAAAEIQMVVLQLRIIVRPLSPTPLGSIARRGTVQVHLGRFKVLPIESNMIVDISERSLHRLVLLAFKVSRVVVVVVNLSLVEGTVGLRLQIKLQEQFLPLLVRLWVALGVGVVL